MEKNRYCWRGGRWTRIRGPRSIYNQINHNWVGKWPFTSLPQAIKSVLSASLYVPHLISRTAKWYMMPRNNVLYKIVVWNESGSKIMKNPWAIAAVVANILYLHRGRSCYMDGVTRVPTLRLSHVRENYQRTYLWIIIGFEWNISASRLIFATPLWIIFNWPSSSMWLGETGAERGIPWEVR